MNISQPFLCKCLLKICMQGMKWSFNVGMKRNGVSQARSKYYTLLKSRLPILVSFLLFFYFFFCQKGRTMISSFVSPIDVATPPPFPSNGTGIANLPNQRHKIVAKNGANFTIMVCGKGKQRPLSYRKVTSQSYRTRACPHFLQANPVLARLLLSTRSSRQLSRIPKT